MKRIIFATVLFIFLSENINAAEWFEIRGETETVLGWKMTVSPAKEPASTETLHFRPPLEKTIDRDALPFYDQASIEFWKYRQDKARGIALNEKYLREAADEADKEKRYKIFLTQQIHAMPLQPVWGDQRLFKSLNISDTEKRRCINELSALFAQLDEAVRSTRFDADRIHSIERLQELRNHARLLTVKSDVEMHEEKFDRACRTINVFYRMAGHVSRDSSLVEFLVGVSMQGIGNAQLMKLSEIPNAPSLLWAVRELKSIPCDPIDIVRDEYTRELSTQLPGFLKFADPNALNDEQARTYLHSKEFTTNMIANFAPEYDRPDTKEPDAAKIEEKLETLLKRGDPIARRKLLEDGLSKETVDSLSREKAFLVASARELNEFIEEIYRLFLSPYWISQPKFKELEKQVRPENETYVLLQQTQVEAWGGLQEAMLRTQFQHEIMMLVEGIRLYAGKHDGKLPETLADLEAMSLPVPQTNPFTGKTYGWTKTDERTLQIDGPGRFTWRYLVTVRK